LIRTSINVFFSLFPARDVVFADVEDGGGGEEEVVPDEEKKVTRH